MKVTVNQTEQLFDAVFAADLEDLRASLSNGADPNLCRSDGTTPLYWAAAKNSSALVEVLVESGARVEAERQEDGHTSLHQAVAHGNVEIVKALLNAGGKSALNIFDYIARTPLMWAADNEDVEVAKLLIEAGADVNAHDESRIGNNALLRAAERDNVEMVQILLAAGADPSIRGWMGITASMAAHWLGGPNAEAILQLLEEYERK